MSESLACSEFLATTFKRDKNLFKGFYLMIGQYEVVLCFLQLLLREFLEEWCSNRRGIHLEDLIIFFGTGVFATSVLGVKKAN